MEVKTCRVCGEDFTPIRKPGARGPLPSACDTCRCKTPLTAEQRSEINRRNAKKRWVGIVAKPRLVARSDDGSTPNRITCAQCSATLTGKQRRFCSRRCSEDAHIARMSAASTYPRQSDCAWCGCAYEQKRGAHTTCSTRCFNRKYRSENPDKYTYNDAKRAADHKRRAIRAGATVERVVSAKVFERDEWTCGLCGEHVDRSLKYPDPKSASLDHIVPLSLGGGHSYANVQCAHLDCNVSKGNRIDGDNGGGVASRRLAPSVPGRAVERNVYGFPMCEGATP